MGSGMSRVVSGLYVGTLVSANSSEQLEKESITHICSVVQHPIRNVSRKHIQFSVEDKPNVDLSGIYEEAIIFIHECRLSGGAVLVHCACGISRSVAITLAYLLTVTSRPLDILLQAVKGARPIANPNFGFTRQLVEFEYGSAIDALRQKLTNRFGCLADSSLLKGDLADIDRLVKAYAYNMAREEKKSIHDSEEVVKAPEAEEEDAKSNEVTDDGGDLSSPTQFSQSAPG